MVSFQCEACGDVLTKKKLDPHRNQCRGAVYSCLDCMTTFQGTEYRSHTSCITEDQKYQGALYREKPSKANNKRKSVSIIEPDEPHNTALVPRPAYVEDAPDVDSPPHVPTPPPAVSSQVRDSVFDYMVEEDLPNTPRITFTESKEEMAMKNNAPSVFTNSRTSSRNSHRDNEERLNDQDYEENGFTYGTEPINPRLLSGINNSMLSLEFMTPAAKVMKSKLDKKQRPSLGHSRTNSGSEKKRKRQTDENSQSMESDTPMADVPRETTIDTPAVVHSGLTGGLNRMMSNPDDEPFSVPRSPPNGGNGINNDRQRTSRRSHRHEDPGSPLKKTRHSKDNSNGLGISIKGRAAKALSMVGGALLPTPQGNELVPVKTRRRASSSEHGTQNDGYPHGREVSEKRDRKKHKVHRHNGTSSSNVRHSRRRASDESPEAQRRKVKAIEYYPPTPHQGGDGEYYSGSESDDERDQRSRGTGGVKQMVVFGAEERTRRRCEDFLSTIPGEDSERGYSINKALKRWHKNNEVRNSSVKSEEEKELWRGLRLRTNDRGEIVIVF